MKHMSPPRPGPAPALVDARQRVLAAVTATDGAGARITDLAQELGVHANTVRHHLAALVDAGLVEESDAEPRGRGRPARLYRTTPAGRRARPGTDAVGYRDLAAALLEVTAGHPGLAREAGLRWGERVARGSPDPQDRPGQVVAAVTEVLDAQGFTATPAGTGREGDITLHTCPLIDEARRDPQAVCGIHESMLQGVLDAWGTGDRVELEPFAVEHGCRLSLHRPGAADRDRSTPGRTDSA
jgi:predicted ArsR family transcriptional regulator